MCLSFKRSVRAMSLLLFSAVAQAATTFSCAPEVRPESCSSAGFWARYEQNSQLAVDSGAEHTSLINQHLTHDEAAALWMAMREDNGPSAGTAALVTRLSVAAQLAWKVAIGEISPMVAGHGARAIADEQDQAALLRTLVMLDRDAALVSALSWTLDHEPTRAITQAWFLLAGNNAAANIALNELIQCNSDGHDGCASALPETVIFNSTQLRAAWGSLSTDNRRALLWRTSGEGVEDFLKGAWQQSRDSNELLALWRDGDAADSRVEAVVAQLILERLLDPAVSGSSRLLMPVMPTSSFSLPELHPLAAAEISAWKRLVERRTGVPGLWSALASSRNPWVKLLGIGGLFACDRQEEASVALAEFRGNESLPYRLLAELFADTGSAAADQMHWRLLAVAPTNIELASELGKTERANREKRLLPEATC